MMKAILWTRDHCGYCDMAKKELMLRGYEVEERNIWGTEWSKAEIY